MPPKKKTNTPRSSDASSEITTDPDENDNMASNTTRALEQFIDSRLNQQSEQLNDLFIKYSHMTKSDLDEIKKSQDFLSSKFDELVVSVNELKAENLELRQENQTLQERINELEKQSATAELDVENLKQYLRRDLLEIHGVPVTEDENTNNIVQKVVQLIDPEFELDESEISTSHRLPASRGNIQPIIVKFTRRSTRDAIYNRKRQLRAKSSLDLGFPQESLLYINESLTAKGRELLAEVKHFKRSHNFKFAWTKQGKVLLRKDDSPSSEVHVFTSMKEFREFVSRYPSRH